MDKLLESIFITAFIGFLIILSIMIYISLEQSTTELKPDKDSPLPNKLISPEKVSTLTNKLKPPTNNLFVSSPRPIYKKGQKDKWSGHIVLQDIYGRIFVVRDNKGWQLPGGLTDPGENQYDGAVREFEEETGYPLSNFNPLFVNESTKDPSNKTFKFMTNKSLRYFLNNNGLQLNNDGFLFPEKAKINPNTGKREHDSISVYKVTNPYKGKVYNFKKNKYVTPSSIRYENRFNDSLKL